MTLNLNGSSFTTFSPLQLRVIDTVVPHSQVPYIKLELPAVTLACGHTRNPDEFVTDDTCDACHRWKLRRQWMTQPDAFKVCHNFDWLMPFDDFDVDCVEITD